MRRALVATVALFAIGGMVMAGGDKPQWLKFDQALKAAEANGRPTAVYATVDESGGGC